MSNSAKFIYTTRNEKWCEGTLNVSDGNDFSVNVENEKLQTVKGFGGCFNELGYDALKELPEEKYNEVMRELFCDEGCGFRRCRMPIGASDYARDWYSLDEVKGDYELKHFSVERDETSLIPYIKDALEVQPEITIFASPWSPPTWMKNPPVYNFGKLIWEEKNLNAYAEYFCKFVEAYEEKGIPIEAIHFQNEVIADQKFPSCVWTGPEMRDFIKYYLGPKMKEKHPDIKLWLGTINAPDDTFGGWQWQKQNFNALLHPVLKDDVARSYIEGIGFQWAGKHTIYEASRAYPELDLAQTENECGNGENSWEYMEYIFSLIWHYFEHGVTSYTYWNMVLKPGGASTWGWHQNSMITVDNGEIIYNPEFYLMKHFGNFVKPMAVMRKLNGHFCSNALAFENVDGSVAVIVRNPFDNEETIKIKLGDKIYEILAKPRSINSVLI